MSLPFLKRGIQPIGVDIGESTLKLLQLQRTGNGSGWSVVEAVRVQLETPLSQAGSERPSVIAAAARTALRGRSFSGTRCVCSLAPGDMLLRTMRTPPMPNDDLQHGCRRQAAERFELEVDDIEAGWLRAGSVLQGDSARDEILLLAAKRQAVTQMLDGLIEGGLCPILVDTPFTALARCFSRTLRRGSDRNMVQMIIDIGAATTDVVIVRGSSIAFIKSIPIGGTALTTAVAAAMKLDEKAAFQLRRERMESPTGAAEHGDRRVGRAVFQAVRSQLNDIADEAALCLRYYSVTFRGHRPERVLITGGDALEPGLPEIISETLKVDAEIGRPLDGIDVSGVNFGLERREASLVQWACACGLGLHPLKRTLPAQTDDDPAAEHNLAGNEADQMRGAA